MKRTYRDIEYTLRRSKRKTANIYIKRGGQVSVLVPATLADAQVGKLLESKRTLIYRNLAEWRDRNAARIQREYVNGEKVLYLSCSYRLKLVAGQAAPLPAFIVQLLLEVDNSGLKFNRLPQFCA